MNQSIGLEFIRLLRHGWSAEEMTSPRSPLLAGGVIAAPAYLNAVSAPTPSSRGL